MSHRWLRRLGTAALAVTFVVAGGVVWRLADRDPELSAPDARSTPELIARGEYLTQAADCAACHTVPGGKQFSGGLAFALPFGTIYSTNITADRESGIGAWSDDDFVRALHTGVAKGGTHLYPAFPYTSYTALSRDDAVAIKAYLFSLPAVPAPARANTLGFPFNQRWTMAFWNLAFLDQRRFQPDHGLSQSQNRGAYLATALGHCGECHTPRDIGFALDDSRALAGTMVEGWRAYNLTPDPRGGLGGWSDRQLADYLATGHAEGRGSAAGPMAEAVENSLRFLTPDDVDALVSYLRTVKPRQGEADAEINPSPGPMAASAAWAPGPQAVNEDGLGRHIFEGACASCHQWNGAGQQTPYAALAGGQTANDPAGTNLVKVLLSGATLRTGNGVVSMPSFGMAYSDAELAAVSNYVIGHFGGKDGEVTPTAVERARQP